MIAIIYLSCFFYRRGRREKTQRKDAEFVAGRPAKFAEKKIIKC